MKGPTLWKLLIVAGVALMTLVWADNLRGFSTDEALVFAVGAGLVTAGALFARGMSQRR